MKLKSSLGRKVSFTATYQKRNTQIDWSFKTTPSLYSNRKYLQIVFADDALKNCYLLVNRKSEKTLELIQKVKQGDKITILADIKPSPAGKTDRGDEYVLLVDSMTPPAKEQQHRNDVPEYDDDSWEY